MAIKNFLHAIKNKHRLIVIVVCALMLLALSYWYHQPIPKYMKTSACSLDGNVVNIEVNIKYYRYLFSPTEARGTVILNGVTYADCFSRGLGVNKNSDFITKVKRKIHDFRYDYFVNAAYLDPIEAFSDQIIILYGDEKSEYICLMIINEEFNDESSPSQIYIAPASTIEEANYIYSNVMLKQNTKITNSPVLLNEYRHQTEDKVHLMGGFCCYWAKKMI